MRILLVAACLLVAGCSANPASEDLDPAAQEPAGPLMDGQEDGLEEEQGKGAAGGGPGAPANETSEPPRASSSGTGEGVDWSEPHVHDLWGKRRSIVVMNDPVDVYVVHNHVFDQPPRTLHTHGCDQELASTSQGGSVVFTLPPGSTVIPGSARLEVEVDWTDPALTGLLLKYRSPDRGGFLEAGLPAPEPGEVLTIPLTRPMADQGHELRSRWDFLLCAQSDGGPVDVAQGGALVTMTIVRVEGDLPVDPGHPDHWQGTHVLGLGGTDWQGEALAAGWRGEDDWIELHPDGIVPWDAEAVRFTCSGEAEGLPEGAVLEAWYSPPDRASEWAFEHVVLGPMPEEGPGGPAGSRHPGEAHLGAVVPIDRHQTDGVYAEESHWMVWFRMRGPVEQGTPGGLGWWTAPGLVQGSVTCAFEALRTNPLGDPA